MFYSENGVDGMVWYGMVIARGGNTPDRHIPHHVVDRRRVSWHWGRYAKLRSPNLNGTVVGLRPFSVNLVTYASVKTRALRQGSSGALLH